MRAQPVPAPVGLCTQQGTGPPTVARTRRRTVQRGDQPVILTGYSALNKLLGREVYTSHMQLGGPKVRHALPTAWPGPARSLSCSSLPPRQAGCARQRACGTRAGQA